MENKRAVADRYSINGFGGFCYSSRSLVMKYGNGLCRFKMYTM